MAIIAVEMMNCTNHFPVYRMGPSLQPAAETNPIQNQE
ncbi:protein of unknown function (plasmid) [Cupriavidus neocaledonicus]|uniref:Uncharacterized protein n=1 Tax=Cupriavidus neocaledonicus TaxID=1040979 RepID=A0A375HTX5_9BURK|nr:hypothetical protein CBM2605_B100134 [Cupriavidus neocaledonicus]SPD60177.1 protein of unknown function [Cupriavidus neocaledonicus]